MVDTVRMTTENAACIITGDFNDFNTDILEQHTLLTQVVEHATRGNSVLDKILTDLVDHYQEPVVSAPISSSDHSVITCVPYSSIAPAKASNIFCFRPFRDSSVRSFGQ